MVARHCAQGSRTPHPVPANGRSRRQNLAEKSGCDRYSEHFKFGFWSVMSTAKRIVYGIGILALVAVLVGVFLPARTQVQREIIIDAPAATVFVLLADLQRARDWWPWIDADAAVVFAEPAGDGVSSMRWDSEQFGTGTRTIVKRVPYAQLVEAIAFGATDRGESTFDISSSAQQTHLSWTYSRDFGVDLPARYAGQFLEARLGEAMQRGLSGLAALAQSLPRVDWSDIPIEELVVTPIDIAYLTATSLPNASAISESMGEAYFNILAFMDRHRLEEAGAPLAISRRFSGAEFVFDAAIPVRGVTADTPQAEGGIRLGKTYGGPVIRGRHLGPYATLRNTHEKIAAYLAVHGLVRAGDAWEAYVGDPARSPEDELVTDVYYPIRRAQAAP